MKDWVVNFASLVTGLYHAMSCSENKALSNLGVLTLQWPSVLRIHSFFIIYQLTLYKTCFSTQYDILYPASLLGVPQGSVLDPNIFFQSCFHSYNTVCFVQHIRFKYQYCILCVFCALGFHWTCDGKRSTKEMWLQYKKQKGVVVLNIFYNSVSQSLHDLRMGQGTARFAQFGM